MKEWALVTGASSGIGKAVAIELSKTYNLVLGGRDEKRLAETAAECAFVCETKIWKFDLTKTEKISETLAAFLAKEKIQIARFVHSAGVSRILPLAVTKLKNVQEVFRVNTIAPLEIVQTLASKRGNSAALKSVVFVSSAIANRGAKGYAVYGASKAALDGLMRGLAVELAPKIRVNSVLPGFVKTPMTESSLADPELVKRLESRYPLGLGEPHSIADAVAFLLSDKSSWITGHQLVIDGGSTVDISA